MNIDKKSTTTIPSSESQNKTWNPLEESRKQKFCVQRTPPLCLRQYVRSTITNVHGDGPWKPAGLNRYIKPLTAGEKEKLHQEAQRIKNKPKIEIRHKTSKGEAEIPWRPSGLRKYESVPYFDSPSLRWSLQDVKHSMGISDNKN
ncbi:hypothetical protein I4U23_015278 [Adineta vaga]|nr:hypothetical protein I4U23_015278 [Adineta vaga]